MELRPILSTLRRHKTAAALIVLEIALSCAIICNAMFLIGGRLERMDRPSGVAEDEIVRIQIAGIGQSDNAAALTSSDLAALRAIPGVKSASVTNEVNFGNSSWNSGVTLTPEQRQSSLNATTYLGDETLPTTMGLTLVAGRFFNADEMVDWDAFNNPGANLAVPVAIITRDMGEKLWPGQDPLGKTFYSWGDGGTRVVGVVDKLARPNEQGGPEAYYYSMLLGFKGRYAIYEQEKLLAIMEETANALVKVGRIKQVELSPNWLANDQPKPPEKRGMPIWAKLGALGGVGLAIIVYGILFMLSYKFLNDTIEKLPL